MLLPMTQATVTSFVVKKLDRQTTENLKTSMHLSDPDRLSGYRNIARSHDRWAGGDPKCDCSVTAEWPGSHRIDPE